MHWFCYGSGLLVAIAIIALGGHYLVRPRAASRSFGLPLPEEGANTTRWLRLKGVRDIASGVVVLAVMAWGAPPTLGLVLLALAIIPIGDMSLVLAARGRTNVALGVHAPTAALMIVAAIPLLMGVA